MRRTWMKTTVSSTTSRTAIYDGLIITGAPVEQIPSIRRLLAEMKTYLDWAKTHAFRRLCWVAQAGLYHHYGIHKGSSAKLGIFEYQLT